MRKVYNWMSPSFALISIGNYIYPDLFLTFLFCLIVVFSHCFVFTFIYYLSIFCFIILLVMYLSTCLLAYLFRLPRAELDPLTASWWWGAPRPHRRPRSEDGEDTLRSLTHAGSDWLGLVSTLIGSLCGDLRCITSITLIASYKHSSLSSLLTLTLTLSHTLSFSFYC